MSSLSKATQYVQSFSDEASPAWRSEVSTDPIPNDPSYQGYTQDELDELNEPFYGREWSSLTGREQLEVARYWIFDCDPNLRNISAEDKKEEAVREELEELSPFDWEEEMRRQDQEVLNRAQVRVEKSRTLKPVVVGSKFDCLVGDVVLK
jgi:hypothetical protein